MKSSSALVAICGLMLSGAAHAGACCVGATSTVPTRLGECEGWLMGMGVQAETTTGMWQSDGQLSQSSMTDDAIITTLAGAWRWDREGQLFATLPMRLNHRAAGDLSELDGGVGDLRAGVIWDPIDEHASSWRPVPVLTLGARLPTGRDWRDAERQLQTDVTGLTGTALIGVLTAERTMGRTPWSLGVDLESGGGITAMGTTAVLGRYIGSQWSVISSLRHSRTITHTGSSTSRTNTGLRLTRGQPMRWRAWIGLDADVPVSGMGQGASRLAHASLGVALIR